MIGVQIETKERHVTEPNLTVQDLYQIVKLTDPQFSPGGAAPGLIAFVRTEIDRETNDYQSAIWLAPVDGGPARRFTSGDKRDHSPRWSPDGRWIAFASNRGGEEARTQLYLIPTGGGEARRLTRMDNGAADPAWSPDGRWLAFTSRVNAEEMAAEAEPEPDAPLDPDERKRRREEKDKREKDKADPRVIDRFAYRAETSYFDDRTKHLYVLEIDPEMGEAQGKPRRLTHDARNYTDPRWLPGGSGLLATVTQLPGEDDLFYHPDVARISVDGGEPEILTGPETADHNPWPSPDGRWIAYNSLPADEYTTANGEIKLIPAEGGEPRLLTAELDAHARDLRWLPDSQRLCFLVSEKGRIELRSVSLDGGPVETLVSAELEMLAYDLSPDGRQVAFIGSTDRAPWDLYVTDLDSRKPNLRRLTEVNGAWLASKELGAVEDLWLSADGTPIQGWIIKPPGFDPQTRYPLVLSIHGGPHIMWSRHEPTMWHEWQVLAAQGYVVLACNPRGSDGYGRDFRAALLGRWGEADLPDLLAGVEAVLALGYVDAGRLALTGGSYGGFMTAWVVGHDDRFRAAVAQRGVYDLAGFYGTSDIPRLVEWEFASRPWEDPQGLWKYSPVAYAENIHTPLLLIHSDNDFRAPIPAAEGLFVALRRLKRTVELVRYPRDGHELSRSGEPRHRVDRLERIVGWFERYVRDSEASEEE
jgi:dipeptidyl aminopeptidase/acylaminoacyl peptidase